VTQLGLGCVGLGSSADRRVADDVRLVHAAIELGIRVFDTADVYGGGASEHVLGRALHRRRDEVTIATKGGFVFRDRRPVEQWARRRAKALRERARSRQPATGGSAPASRSYAQQDFSPRYLRDAIHASLRRLGTDRIDVYQLHGPDAVLPELIDQLADLVVAGDVVRFGVGADSVAAADAWAGVSGIRLVQVPFGVLDPEAAATTLPLARRHGCEVWARGVLGGGLFGLADRDPGAIADHPKLAQVEAIRRYASECGLDAYQLAFGFVRARAADVSTVLVGSTSPEHLRRNLESLAAPPLTSDVLHALSELAAPTVENA
jgi:aryl-alcohol dehydrogenase-like predicted oxidoreductase